MPSSAKSVGVPSSITPTQYQQAHKSATHSFAEQWRDKGWLPCARSTISYSTEVCELPRGLCFRADDRRKFVAQRKQTCHSLRFWYHYFGLAFTLLPRLTRAGELARRSRKFPSLGLDGERDAERRFLRGRSGDVPAGLLSPDPTTADCTDLRCNGDDVAIKMLRTCGRSVVWASAASTWAAIATLW